MAVVAFDEDLPGTPRRVLVAGTSGSGKTTMAVRIAAILAIPHIEIDALYHGSNWTPREAFADDVARFAAQPTWVTEWQYGSVRSLLARRADLMVWLDLPTPVVMRQVVVRTVRRRWRRQVLWNGNVEPALWKIFTDQDHIVRWAWRTRHKPAARIENLLRENPELPVVRLRSHREGLDWLAGPLLATQN